MFKIAFAAGVTAALCFCISLSAGVASTAHSESSLTVRVGDSISVPALDLSCIVFATDPEHLNPGPDMYCYRSTAIEKGHGSRSIKITSSRIGVTGESGNSLIFQADRSP